MGLSDTIFKKWKKKNQKWELSYCDNNPVTFYALIKTELTVNEIQTPTQNNVLGYIYIVKILHAI